MKLKKGFRVRLVKMDGCMAHVRGEVREGTITGYTSKQLHGDTKERNFVVIKMDDGTEEERESEPQLWIQNEGVLEYRH